MVRTLHVQYSYWHEEMLPVSLEKMLLVLSKLFSFFNSLDVLFWKEPPDFPKYFLLNTIQQVANLNL